MHTPYTEPGRRIGEELYLRGLTEEIEDGPVEPQIAVLPFVYVFITLVLAGIAVGLILVRMAYAIGF